MSVISEFKKMRLKLGQAFYKVGSIMMSNPQSPSILDNIKYVLSTYNKAMRPQLVQCKDIHDVLQLVSENSLLDDISILEYLVDEFNLEEAQVVIWEYKEAFEELKEIKFSQCLNEQLSFASPLECERITIIADKDTEDSVLNDVKRLSSAVYESLPQHVRLNVIRDDGGMEEVLKQKSFTDTFDDPTLQSEDTMIAAGLSGIISILYTTKFGIINHV